MVIIVVYFCLVVVVVVRLLRRFVFIGFGLVVERNIKFDCTLLSMESLSISCSIDFGDNWLSFKIDLTIPPPPPGLLNTGIRVPSPVSDDFVESRCWPPTLINPFESVDFYFKINFKIKIQNSNQIHLSSYFDLYRWSSNFSCCLWFTFRCCSQTVLTLKKKFN